MKHRLTARAFAALQANMQQHMARLKEDPETADIIRELEQGGPAAMSACVPILVFPLALQVALSSAALRPCLRASLLFCLLWCIPGCVGCM